ncbi:hypothetical protein ASC77_17160 [Nocardioides sp. Root1257]|uniref:DUF6458 family protein n=1 Tax=unclassified Nocardioides TaxID=2615069 RepID=UPI0006F7CA72|nr:MULTISPECIES: DUF6458 family protein [unclassified Nocardioides]KQW47162.1 hypothetical protein ASC77_17160 [Nocardioides sp. Root1257]KRC43909.1 hypothetical protein ASE24_18115 [Nocardioides sp. Root224]
MGYGVGVFLLALGLILALAVQDSLSGVDLTMVGWILAAVGVLALVLTAVTLNRRGQGSHTRATTTRADGSQTVRESRTDL